VSDRHSGPRREVKRVRRVGSYGSVWWLHDLECGHVERRKRASSKPEIGCAACKSDERLLINVLRTPEFDSGRDAQVQVEADQLRAKLASALGVPLDAVGVQVATGGQGSQVSGAMIFLHPEAANSVVERFDSVARSDYAAILSDTEQEVSYYFGEN
jgi:hypothetical protein